MLTHPTLDQLRALRLDGMAEAFAELQVQDGADDLTHADWLALLIDRELADRNTRRFRTRLRAAALRHVGAIAEIPDNRLLNPRRDLALEAALAKLDKFDLLILDDITYAQKDQAETSVLFELIARRYETRSLAIAANQPFSAWERVFPDKAVTVAAIDRLVHHATILEMNVDSYRRRAAADRKNEEAVAPATTSADNLNDNQKGDDEPETTSTAAARQSANLVVGAGQNG